MAWIPASVRRLIPDGPLSDTGDDDGGGAIRSDDFGWARRMPKPLRMLCVDEIAADFALFPHELFDTLPPMYAEYLAEALDTDLPVTLVEHVPVDEYWRRRLDDMTPRTLRQVRSPTAAARQPARSECLNQLASRTFEDLEPAGHVDDERPELAVFGRHVTTLRVGRLRAGIGTELGRLTNLRSLSLCFDLPAVGSRFSGLTEADVDALGRGLAALHRLAALTVTWCCMDATRFDTLSPYLAQCHRLQDVDLSHCQLGCAGAASVARYAGTARSLRSVVLCDNDVAADGVQSLALMAVARRKNGYQAIELNLNMNYIMDTGAKYLASALASGSQPFTKLRISTCKITEIGGINIVESLAYDQGLRALEIDNNPLTLKVGIALHAALKTNFNITYLSTQNCKFPTSMALFFNSVAYYNRINKRTKLNYVNIKDLCDPIEEENIFVTSV